MYLLAHVLEGVVQDPLLEQVHKLLELALGLLVDEVVIAEVFDRPAQVLRQVLHALSAASGALFQELHQPFPFLGILRRRLGLLLPCVLQAPVDALALGLDDLLQTFLEVVKHRVQVVATELLLPAASKALQHIPQSLHTLVGLALHSPLEQVAQRPHKVAVAHKVVGHLVHDVFSRWLEDLLSPVPL